MISTTDFKKGARILFEGEPYVIMEYSIQTPSARGASALCKAKVRNLKTGRVFSKSWKAGERFEEPDIDRRKVQYLYDDGEALVFMDTSTYEQLFVQGEELGDAKAYLVDNLELSLVFFEGAVIGVELPPTMDFEVDETDEAASPGDTAKGAATKPAVLTNGLRVQVPLYVRNGMFVRIATDDGRYMERVK
jgi:elongation factor P